MKSYVGSGGLVFSASSFWSRFAFLGWGVPWALEFGSLHLLVIIKNYLLIDVLESLRGKDGERERERERVTLICCSVHLCVHWWFLVCALSRDQMHNLRASGCCSNHLSSPVRAAPHSLLAPASISSGPWVLLETLTVPPLFLLCFILREAASWTCSPRAFTHCNRVEGERLWPTWLVNTYSV